MAVRRSIVASQRVQTFIFFTRRLSRNFTASEDDQGRAGGQQFPALEAMSSVVLTRLAGFLVAAGGLAACGAPLDRGTHAPRRFVGDDFGRTSSYLARRVGEVLVVEGDGLVSGIEGRYGIRFDDEVNDLARVTTAFAEAGADEPGLLLLFTTFEDLGSGRAAYYVPFFDDVQGTGDDDVDQRAEFGVTSLEGIVNFGAFGDEPEALFFHEIAHRHLAHLEALVGGSTTTAPLLGRQRAHWHAMLATDGSVLGGHAFVESQPGRFVVTAREVRYSALDLYGLGLLSEDDVPPFFFVADATTEGGAAIPSEAQLEPGSVVLGRRVDVTIEDVVAAVGRRVPAFGEAPTTIRVRYGLLGAPGESVSDADIEAVDALRIAMDEAYVAFTDGRGALCSRIDGCAPPMKAPADESKGCSCSSSSAPRRGPPMREGGALGRLVLLLVFGVGVRAVRRRTPTRTNRI